MYYIYVIQSLKDKQFYTGFTTNLDRRVNEHNQSQQISTQGRAPFRVIYYEWALHKKDAIAREKYLKSGMGKKYLRNRLKYYLEM